MSYLLAVAALFVFFSAIEKRFYLRKQRTFRSEWCTDLIHLGIDRFLVDLGTIMVAVPFYIVFGWAIDNPLAASVTAQPMPVQFVEAWFICEFCFYWVHRFVHAHPWLARAHAIHHSSRQLDWLAAARFHPLDAIAARIGVGVPLLLLGFNLDAFGGYLLWSTLVAIFVHANVRWKHPRWFWLLVGSPEFHRWHHSKEACNKNFGHPLFDFIFATFYLPRDREPESYGIGATIPRSYFGQLFYPWRSRLNR
jgi:sterol desaturase/sphingolipid hydroxylase (fatty acid hydroxylase superfamily)